MNNYHKSFFEEKMPKKVSKSIGMVFAFIFLMAGVFAAEGDGKLYTDNFYIFLGLLISAIIIIGVFVWFWIRGPVNKWKNN